MIGAERPAGDGGRRSRDAAPTAGEPQPGHRWRLLGTRPPQCPFGSHRVGASLDESARRLTHSEYAVAVQLAAEGHRVRSLPDRRGAGRVPDLDVCGTGVEVKTWLPPEDRSGRPPTARSVFNKLADARGQGATTVLWAKGSGLQALDAQRGVELFAASGRFGGITTVRVLGDGFDLAWGRPPDLGVMARRASPGRPPGPAVAAPVPALHRPDRAAPGVPRAAPLEPVGLGW